MPALYTHTFTWPPTPSHSVTVTGTFDSWSGDRHHLHRGENGYWQGTVDIPYGERVAYKYVVDGNWLIREDEAKEWDAAGNMNNIFTPPSAPSASSAQPSASSHVEDRQHTSAAAAAGAGAGLGVAAVATHEPTAQPQAERQVTHSAGEPTLIAKGDTGDVAPVTGTTVNPTSTSDDVTSDHKPTLKERAMGVKQDLKELISSKSTSSSSEAVAGPEVKSETGVNRDHTGLNRESEYSAREPTATKTAEVSVPTSADRSVPAGHSETLRSETNTLEAGKVTEGASTKAGSTLLGGLNLGAPIGGGDVHSFPTTTTTTTYLTGTNTGSYGVESSLPHHTGPTTTSAHAVHAQDETSSASAYTESSANTPAIQHADTERSSTPAPSEPLKALADGGPLSTTHHEPADALRDLADATAPVLGSTAGSTNARVHEELNTVDQTPAAPLKALADAPVGTSSTTTTSTPDAQTLSETVSNAGTSALAAIGLAAGGLVAGITEAVHTATGYDIAHTDPISVEEAKARGISLSNGEQQTTGSTAQSTVSATPGVPHTTLSAPVSGPSPTQFASPAIVSAAPVVPRETTSSTIVTPSGPSPAEVGGISTGHKPIASMPKPADIPAPVPVQTHSPAHASPLSQSQTATSSAPANRVAANTQEATSSRPAEAKEVDVFSSNNGHPNKVAHDIPAQHETKDANHKKVPQPTITTLGGSTKDRTKPSPTDEAGKEMSSRPDASAKQTALQDEKERRGEAEPSRSYAKKPEVATTTATPPTLPLATTQAPIAKDVAPSTPAKNNIVVPVGAVAGTPQTPASRVANRESLAPNTPSSTTSSTPGRHTKEESSDTMRKRKSSFFAKIKGAFNKDKSSKA